MSGLWLMAKGAMRPWPIIFTLNEHREWPSQYGATQCRHNFFIPWPVIDYICQTIYVTNITNIKSTFSYVLLIVDKKFHEKKKAKYVKIEN